MNQKQFSYMRMFIQEFDSDIEILAFIIFEQFPENLVELIAQFLNFEDEEINLKNAKILATIYFLLNPSKQLPG